MMYKVDAMFDSSSQSGNGPSCLHPVPHLLCAQVSVRRSCMGGAGKRPDAGFQGCGHPCLIKYISEATGRNFITDPAVKGKVTVYSPVRISPDEAFETFVSILRVQGYAVQKSGTAYKIVPLKEGIGQGEDAAVGRKMGSELETVVTQIVPLKVGVAAELAKILPPCLGRSTPFPPIPHRTPSR
mgnify:CR=1 FL=1